MERKKGQRERKEQICNGLEGSERGKGRAR